MKNGIAYNVFIVLGSKFFLDFLDITKVGAIWKNRLRICFEALQKEKIGELMATDMLPLRRTERS